MAELRQINSNAADYLNGIENQLWVTAFHEGPYCGHKTSHVVESTNKVFVDNGEKPALTLLHTVHLYVMNKRFQRKQKSQDISIEQKHTTYCLHIMKESQSFAASNTVHPFPV